MAEQTAVAIPEKKRSLVATLAARYEIEPENFMEAVRQTVMPQGKDAPVASNAMIAAFLMVCNEHGLNPFTREIFAFPTRSGGIQPIVSIDGWVKLVNQHPQFAGMDMNMELGENGKPLSCTCTIFRKDREHQIPITEYYDECYRNTDPWNKMPKRMMRHKALKEAARYTFGFAGIMDEDEGIDAINITEQSTVMERSTLNKTEALKEKIGAKKESKTANGTAEKPVETTATTVPAPTAPPVEVKDTEAPKPAETVIAPAPAAQPAALITEEQAKGFLKAMEAKAVALGVDAATAKSKAREFLFNAGAAKLRELPASAYDGLLQAVNGWTL
jgi:phage recombination protein Bet